MTRGKQTTALALAGAVALASGAYALGTQADDGNAAAAKVPPASPAARATTASAAAQAAAGQASATGSAAARAGRCSRASRIASACPPSKLRAALEDLRTDAHDQFAAELATALGIDKAKVTAALEKAKPERPRMRAPRAFARTLAKELGISTAKVRAALAERRNRRGGPGDLAKALGVTEEQLRDAFHAVMGKIRPPHPPGRPGLSNLADDLGVTEQQLEDALAKVRDDHDQLRDELANELAKRLEASTPPRCKTPWRSRDRPGRACPRACFLFNRRFGVPLAVRADHVGRGVRVDPARRRRPTTRRRRRLVERADARHVRDGHRRAADRVGAARAARRT